MSGVGHRRDVVASRMANPGMTGMTRMSNMRPVAVLSKTTHGHSDQAYTSEGESGQIDIHAPNLLSAPVSVAGHVHYDRAGED